MFVLFTHRQLTGKNEKREEKRLNIDLLFAIIVKKGRANIKKNNKPIIMSTITTIFRTRQAAEKLKKKKEKTMMISSPFSFLLSTIAVLLFSSLCSKSVVMEVEAARTLKQFAGMEQAMAEQGGLSAQQQKNNVLGKGTIVPSAEDLENPVRNENPALLRHIQDGAKDESEQAKRLKKLHKVLNVHGHLKTVANRNPDSGYFVVAFAFIILWIGVYVRQTVDHVNQVRAQERLEARALNNKLERKQFATGNTGDNVADNIALRFELEEAKNEAEKLRKMLNEREASNSKDANVSSSTLSERAAATLDFIKRKD